MSIANEIQRLQTAKTDIKTAIESKGVTVGDGTIDTYAEKINEISVGGSGDYEQGYEDGKNDEYNAFWDSIYALNNTHALFCGKAWNDETFKPPKDIVLTTDIRWMFYRNGVKNLKACLDDRGIKLDFTNIKHTADFLWESDIEHIGEFDLSTCINTITINGSGLFSRCTKLVTIEKLKWNDNITIKEQFANNATKLQNVTLEGTFKESISFITNSALSDASIQNIINCLADLTGGTAQTLTLHANAGAKLTDEQKATITAKNWTLVY